MAGFVKLLPSKFLQRCVFRLGICELTQSGLPICALFTFEAIIVRAPEKNVNMQAEAEGGEFLTVANLTTAFKTNHEAQG